MFFNHHITVLFITVGKIRAAVFSSRGKIIREEKIYDWTEESLPAALKDIASRGPNCARIVFGEEFSYVANLKLVESDRGKVLLEAKENIPDELSNNWDFQKESDPDFPTQVAAVQQYSIDFFKSNFEKTNLKVEAIEPQSVALARLLPETGLFLFIAKYEKVLFGAVRDGIVAATYVASDASVIPDFNLFLSYVKRKYSAVPEKVFVSSDINPKSNVFSQNSIQAEVFDLNPLLGTALKKDITGEDWNVLNIDWKNK